MELDLSDLTISRYALESGSLLVPCPNRTLASCGQLKCVALSHRPNRITSSLTIGTEILVREAPSQVFDVTEDQNIPNRHAGL